jgi:hypothetical protein
MIFTHLNNLELLALKDQSALVYIKGRQEPISGKILSITADTLQLLVSFEGEAGADGKTIINEMHNYIALSSIDMCYTTFTKTTLDEKTD